MVQPDVKRLVAYSSVSHMGFVVLGIFSFTELQYAGRALSNAESRRFDWCPLLLSASFTSGATRARSASLADTPMPWFATLFVIASLSSIGLPFLNGFVANF